MMNVDIKLRKSAVRKSESTYIRLMSMKDISHIAENHMFIVIDSDEKPIYMIPEDAVAYISMEYIDDTV